MNTTELNDLLKQISENITCLEQLKEKSPDVQEALNLQAEQERLAKKLQEGCKEQVPHYIPYPVQIYPDWTWRPQRYDWWDNPYRITISTGTTTVPETNCIIS